MATVKPALNAWRIHNNVEAHGLPFAGATARRQGIPFDTFYYQMFGRYPTR